MVVVLGEKHRALPFKCHIHLAIGFHTGVGHFNHAVRDRLDTFGHTFGHDHTGVSVVHVGSWEGSHDDDDGGVHQDTWH